MRPIDADRLYAPRSVRRVTEYDETGCGMDYLAVPWEVIEDAPTLDCDPVRHGEWIERIDPFSTTATGKPVYEYRCSACKFMWTNKRTVEQYFKYCPECGAKMDGEK